MPGASPRHGAVAAVPAQESQFLWDSRVLKFCVSGAVWAVVRAELCGVGLDLLGAPWDDGDAGWLWSCRDHGRP